MTPQQITLVVGAVCGTLALAAWAGLVLVPAWRSYGRLWERLAAAVLSVYVLAALVLAGGVVGAVVAYHWDDLVGG